MEDALLWIILGASTAVDGALVWFSGRSRDSCTELTAADDDDTGR